MLTSSGQFDRRVTLLSPTSTVSPTGQRVASWTTVGDVWASRMTESQTEPDRDGEFSARTVSEVWVRWRVGLTAGWRVIYHGETYEVTGVREVGRREALALALVRVGGPA